MSGRMGNPLSKAAPKQVGLLQPELGVRWPTDHDAVGDFLLELGLNDRSFVTDRRFKAVKDTLQLANKSGPISIAAPLLGEIARHVEVGGPETATLRFDSGNFSLEVPPQANCQEPHADHRIHYDYKGNSVYHGLVMGVCEGTGHLELLLRCDKVVETTRWVNSACMVGSGTHTTEEQCSLDFRTFFYRRKLTYQTGPMDCHEVLVYGPDKQVSYSIHPSCYCHSECCCIQVLHYLSTFNRQEAERQQQQRQAEQVVLLSLFGHSVSLSITHLHCDSVCCVWLHPISGERGTAIG